MQDDGMVGRVPQEVVVQDLRVILRPRRTRSVFGGGAGHCDWRGPVRTSWGPAGSPQRALPAPAVDEFDPG